MNFKKLIFSLAFFLVLVQQGTAQDKRLVTTDDYKLWSSLGVANISNDGNWVMYVIARQEDNDTLYVKNAANNTEYVLANASGGVFSNDNKWFAYRQNVSYKEQEAAREGNKPVETKLGLINLQTGEKEVIGNLARFEFSRDAKHLVIYLAKPRESKEKGSALLLRNLSNGTTRNIGNVTEFGFNKPGNRISYITDSNPFKTVEIINLSTAVTNVIASDTTNFSKLTWDKEGTSLAFYQENKDKKYIEENQKIHHYTGVLSTPILKTFDPSKTSNFPEGMRIFGESNLQISDDMQTVFFGIQPWTLKDTTKAKPKNNDKLPGVDIWHFADKEIQPRQRVTINQTKNQSHLSAWWPNQNRYVRIGNDAQPMANLTGNHKHAVVYNPDDYKPAFKEDYADFYIVNTATGEKASLLERQLNNFNAARTSPGGRFIAYFKDQHWWVYNIAAKMHTNITRSLGVPLHSITYDGPGTPPPYGLVGFSKEDKELIINDQFDVWTITPDGRTAKKMTNGRAQEVVYRLQRLDFEEPFIDLTKAQYFSMYGDKTKKTGYAKWDPRGTVSTLVMDDMAINRIAKARDAEKFIYVQQKYDVSPILMHAGANLTSAKNIVKTNTHQENFHWGKSELVSFTNADGKAMQGALFYPANYEPGKQYPLVVYIYEILSNTVHFYTNPSQRQAYNTSNLTADGYFVFRPDIVYDINDPGVSAVKCVVPAVEQLLKTGMIDKNRMGLMGHSWGAYQTSFIVTQTDMFKGAIAGAPLTDMISMSLSIYWNTGTPDQKIFETSQGRFSGPWYEEYEAHKRNSPIYGAQNIKTPLLVAFGDKDGAVDWQQGIELYGTMRRMEKEHVLLVYEGENHGLAKRENQIDYYQRTKDWLDHYVLGKEPAKWITEGVSYFEKMKAREKK